MTEEIRDYRICSTAMPGDESQAVDNNKFIDRGGQDMEQVINYITSNITTIIQVATLVAVIVYTVYTARMTSAARASADAANNTVNEMKEAREQENAPYIVVYFDIPANKHVIYLIIKNVGKSIATDVKLTFTPSLSSNVFKDINETPLIKDGISSLPPNYELRTLFDGVINRFGNANFPMTYVVEVSYTGGLAKERRTSTQALDLSMFYGLMQVKEKGLNELVKTVETIADNTGKINGILKDVSESLTSGIWIKNPTLTTSDINPRPETWYDSVLAKLQGFVLLWTCAYGKSEEKQVDPFLTDLQNKLILISEQLLVILSESPNSASNEVKEAIAGIATNLQDLGYKKFYIDGGASLNAFDLQGDSAVQVIGSLIKQVFQEKQQIVDTIVEERYD